MPRAEEFDAFYARTRAPLLQQTYAFSGDLGVAAAAVRDAFAHAWQRWPRLRTRDAATWVRQEANRLARLRHDRRRRARLDEAGADAELLDALQELPAQHRWLVLLQRLGGLDLSSAAGEVGLTDSAARAATDSALGELSRQLSRGSVDAGMIDLDSRLDGLRTVSEQVAMPRGLTIRQRGRRRQRRGTLAAVVTTTAAVVAAGTLATMPSDAAPEAQDRAPADATSTTPAPPEPPGVDEGQLLAASQLAPIAPPRSWRLAGNSAVASVCQPSRSADPRPRSTLVRTFRADSGHQQRLVQTVEVSRNGPAALQAYHSTLSWYAGCQAASVQLSSYHVADHARSHVRILTLREWQAPRRTLTVAMSRSGVVTTALVHEVARVQGPSPGAMTRTMSTALDRLCRTSGGRCGTTGRPQESRLPPTGEGAGFLGVVDLPPVADQDTVWAGTEPGPTAENPAAGLCDQTDFTSPAFVRARSRSFVMPESDLLSRFGLSETVGLTRDNTQAGRLVAATVTRVQSCPDRELSAGIDSYRQVGGDELDGHVWQLSFEVDDGAEVTYRLGLVRLGTRVAELSFSGAPSADVGAEAFANLVLRAGERLRELDAG